MKKLLLLFSFLITLQNVFGQVRPTYFPTLESNRPKGDRYLYYRIYASSNSTHPNNAAEFEANFVNNTNYRNSGYVRLIANTGNLNSSSSSTVNILNWLTTAEFTTAISNSTPYSGFTGDGYSVVISGYFIPKQTGTYTFSIEGDDAVDVYVNNTLVAYEYGPHGTSAIGTHFGTINLVAGKRYTMRARMNEGAGGDGLRLFWKKPSEASGSIWYQDFEEISGDQALSNGLVFSVDPSNWYTFPKHGTTVYDLEQNATGTMGGNIVYDSLTAGGVFRFDGNADYVDFGKTPNNFPTGDISVFLWVRPTTLTVSWNIFLTKWFTDNAGNGGYPDFHYGLYPIGSSLYQNLYTTSQYDLFGATALTNNTWYQLGFTISGGNMQMYMNGQKDGASRTNSRTNYTQSNLWLGDARANLLGLIGNIGSVLIYNRGITADEVLQNFNATKHKYGFSN
jgi:hypothetical protein